MVVVVLFGTGSGNRTRAESFPHPKTQLFLMIPCLSGFLSGHIEQASWLVPP